MSAYIVVIPSNATALFVELKQNCKLLELNLKIFFTAFDYFDQICSIFVSFDITSLKQISDLCIILSAKLNENISTAMKVKCALDGSSNKNYVKDELYLLKLDITISSLESYLQ